VVVDNGRRRTGSAARFVVAVVSLVLGLTALAAHPAAARASTTVLSAASFADDAPGVARVGHYPAATAETGSALFSAVQGGSAWSPGGARNTSTTPVVSLIATDAGDGLLSPGPHAGRSIPGDETRVWSRAQRDQINEIMEETGCHRCGTRDPGTKSGDAIPDHQPPLSQSPGPYELYPHCKSCSWDQLQEIARLRREAIRAAKGE